MARAPMVRYVAADLRAEINHRCGGEDSRITIERLHERRRDVEGRDLQKEFNAHVPARGGPPRVCHRPLAH
jgi:hypothetical protein